MSRSNLEKIVLTIVLVFSLIGSFLMFRKLEFINHTTFVDLALSFFQGKIYLVEPIRYSSWQDSAFFNGKYYVYFSPIPTILLLPFVFLLRENASQRILAVFLGIFNFLLLFKIGKSLKLRKNDALWLTLGFIFGSVYLLLNIVNISAYLVQITGFTFLLLSLLEYFTKRRWWLIGIFFSLAGMTRMSLYFTFPFFLINIWKNGKEKRKKNLFYFILPVIFSVLILAFYNFLRFGSLFDTGYRYNTTFPPEIQNAIEKYGLFSFKNIPTNLYFLFYKGPEVIKISEKNYLLKYPFLKASEWGMGIFFTSPFFIYLFFLRLRKNKLIIPLLSSCFLGILPALTYTGIGLWQFGYRYALDIYPFIFILLSLSFQKGMPTLAKFLIVYSIIFNLFLMGSIWGIYLFS